MMTTEPEDYVLVLYDNILLCFDEKQLAIFLGSLHNVCPDALYLSAQASFFSRTTVRWSQSVLALFQRQRSFIHGLYQLPSNASIHLRYCLTHAGVRFMPASWEPVSAPSDSVQSRNELKTLAHGSRRALAFSYACVYYLNPGTDGPSTNANTALAKADQGLGFTQLPINLGVISVDVSQLSEFLRRHRAPS